jgi:hypothetical protein
MNDLCIEVSFSSDRSSPVAPAAQFNHHSFTLPAKGRGRLDVDQCARDGVK